jgi:hypothetical protein
MAVHPKLKSYCLNHSHGTSYTKCCITLFILTKTEQIMEYAKHTFEKNVSETIGNTIIYCNLSFVFAELPLWAYYIDYIQCFRPLTTNIRIHITYKF